MTMTQDCSQSWSVGRLGMLELAFETISYFQLAQNNYFVIPFVGYDEVIIL